MREEALSESSRSGSSCGKDKVGPVEVLEYFKAANQAFIDAEEEIKQEARKPKIKPFWRIKPVSVEVFVRDYMRSVEPSPSQWDVIKAVFPGLPGQDTPFFGVKEIILRIGQRGGKNTVMLVVCDYAFYLWCCLEDPHEYFHLQKDENFDVLIYSQVNQMQARRVFFGRLSHVMLNTVDPETGHNWYSQNMGLRIKEYGHKDIKEESMNIPNRNRMYGGISIYVLDTSFTGVEGYTIWMRITDEPSRANTPVLYEKALHQYETAQTNLEQSFRPYFGLGMMFAYPEQETNDLLVKLYNDHVKFPKPNSMEVNNGVLVAWYFTHVFNPKLSQKDYEEAKNKPGADLIDMKRRWEAIVPPNEFGFFMPYVDKINECANPNIVNPVEYKSSLTERIVSVKGREEIRKFMAVELIKVKADRRQRFWGMDASENSDSFIIVGGYPEILDHDIAVLELEHYDKDGKRVVDKISINCKPVIDIIIRYKPSRTYPVDYVNVENVLVRLLGDEFRESKAISSDKYQSVGFNQKMLDIGIRGAEAIFPSNPVQVRRGKIVRYLVWNNVIEYLDDPVLIREMNKLLLINNNKLDHPAGESKDIYDAMANCVCQIIEMGSNMGALDISGIQDEGQTEDEKKKMEMYQDGLKRFNNKYQRTYDDAREFCKFMKEIGYKFDEYDVQICEVELDMIELRVRRSMPHAEDFHQGGGGLDIGF